MNDAEEERRRARQEVVRSLLAAMDPIQAMERPRPRPPPRPALPPALPPPAPPPLPPPPACPCAMAKRSLERATVLAPTALQAYLSGKGPGEALPLLAGNHGLIRHEAIQKMRLHAKQRTLVLSRTLSIPLDRANQWRIRYERRSRNRKVSLWQTLKDCCREQKCNPTVVRRLQNDNDDDDDDDNLVKEIVERFGKRLRAERGRAKFQAALEAMKPLAAGATGVACPVCFETFGKSDMVACCNEETKHYLCRQCLPQYACQTVESGGLSEIPCADPSCEALFSTDSIQQNLSDWDKLELEERQDRQNIAAALDKAKVLSCRCGAVAVVEEKDQDKNQTVILCPGVHCNLSYCLVCGSEASLDPSQRHDCGQANNKSIAWIKRKTQACPKCRSPIEKNGGCAHMTCRCGQHFQWKL